MADLLEISCSAKTSWAGDVVFVHGLDGNVRDTWQVPQNPATFWPQWLADDFPEMRVWSLDYEASSTRWKGTALPLLQSAINALSTFEAFGIGRRPLVYITHSLGGLLVKQALRRAMDLGSPKSWQRVASQTRGIVFLATPHSGATMATAMRAVSAIIPGIRPTSLVEDLTSSSLQLWDLNCWFRTAIPHLNIKVQTYTETKPLGLIRVVDLQSSDPGIAESTPVPLDADHVSICKPTSRTSLIYRCVSLFAKNLFSEAQERHLEHLAEREPLVTATARILRIFVSCPDDAQVERQGIESSVRQVSAAFAPFGLTLSTWRYDLDAMPSLGSDPQQALNEQIPSNVDFYVGIMRNRVGSPTPRAESGTIEEFEKARSSWEKQGRPLVFFYFYKGEPDPDPSKEGRLQRELVNRFRRRFPGLYGTYASPQDLAAQFEHHLIRAVLKTVFSTASASPAARQFDAPSGRQSLPWDDDWVLALDRRIDQEFNNWHGLIDYSSQRPRRIMTKLDELFGMQKLLSQDERTLLLAVIYLRTAAVVNTAVIQEQLLPEAFQAAHTIASMVGSFPGAKVKLDPFARRVNGDQSSVRLDLLTSIVRIGELLDLDGSALTPRGRTQRISQEGSSEPEIWQTCLAAQLTKEIRIRPHIVTFMLLVPAQSWVNPLKRSTALRLEAQWQNDREILLPHGFSFSIAPAIVDAADPRAETLLKALQDFGDDVAKSFETLPHLGDKETLSLSHIFPLPDSRTSGSTTVPLIQGDYEHFVILEPLHQSHTPESSRKEARISSRGDFIVIDCNAFSELEDCRWTLYRDNFDGCPMGIATGILRPLSPREAIAKTITDQLMAEADRRAYLASMGLWNEWLLNLWEELTNGKATLEEYGVAHDVLASAYRSSVNDGHIASLRADAYRGAINWIQSQFFAAAEDSHDSN